MSDPQDGVYLDSYRAEVERLTAERDVLWAALASREAVVNERDALAARLAAVEALAEGPTGDGYQPYAVTIDTETHLAVLLDDLRAALATEADQ